MKKYVYSFNEGGREMKNLLGGKGANLAEMTNIGLPVPFGFTITTEACNQYFADGRKLNQTISDQIDQALMTLEKVTGKNFGGSPNLLVSVRSGAVHSMPGMMDTILNLGINDENVKAFAKATTGEFAYDCYRRFIQMYSNVVLGVGSFHFDGILNTVKKANAVDTDQELTSEMLQQVIAQYKQKVVEETGQHFPDSPKKQLTKAIKAVFDSWNNDRAVIYRQLNNIPDDTGTAVNVQMMVFGNSGEESGTGVVFTRNPSTGENKLYGEFLMNAQGEDVVAGIRTPLDVTELDKINSRVYKELVEASTKLESHYKNMQDIEFTIENGKFYSLQTRNGKRSAEAAVKIAVDLQNEGLIDRQEAVNLVDVRQVDALLHPCFDPEKLNSAKILGTGLPAGPGAATGKVYFDSASAATAKEVGFNVILVREETSPEDIQGMIAAEGILTARGGMTSHAAVVARGMGKCCISGCSEAHVDEKNKNMTLGEVTVKEGDFISLDGSTGKVYDGQIPTVSASVSEDFQVLMSWADKFSDLTVLANADNPRDASKALELGAKGIGLCRTEHMFFEEDRVLNIRAMIMAKSDEDRKSALEKLYPAQKEDFKALFGIMGSKPVNIRLLDPPLHEFLPKGRKEILEMAMDLDVKYEDIERMASELSEVNPMMGFRGCRLGLIYPEIYSMQIRAIIDAAVEVVKTGQKPNPEIMIPLVSTEKEIENLRALAKSIIATHDPKKLLGRVKVGTMIETPRACLVAGEIARHADYFSFGTNDLTQMTFGFSRDDASPIIRRYREREILVDDPFLKLDNKGVGLLIKMAVDKGKEANPNLKTGICGEQSGDPASIKFLNTFGLDYISCSPYRIPKARLASAQAQLAKMKQSIIV